MALLPPFRQRVAQQPYPSGYQARGAAYHQGRVH
jgi:hypothetical protein